MSSNDPIWIDDSSDEEVSRQLAKPSASSKRVPKLETRMSSMSVDEASARPAVGQEDSNPPTNTPSTISRRKEPSSKYSRIMTQIKDGRGALIDGPEREPHRVYDIPEPFHHAAAPPPPDLSLRPQVRPADRNDMGKTHASEEKKEFIATGSDQHGNTTYNNLAIPHTNFSSIHSMDTYVSNSASNTTNLGLHSQQPVGAAPGTQLSIHSGFGVPRDKPRALLPLFPSAVQSTHSQANLPPPIPVSTSLKPINPPPARQQLNTNEDMLFARAPLHTNTGNIVQHINPPHGVNHSGLSTGRLTRARRTAQEPPSANLPYGLEHSVLTTVQKLLEGALFDFAKAWAPRLLHEVLGFTAPEQGELSAWAPALHKYKGDLLYAFKNMNNTKSADGFLAILTRLHELRHVAVHRQVVGTHGLRRFLPDALEVTGAILQDVPRHQKLRAIEWALWKPQDIDLQEVLSKPEEEFVKLSLPKRDDFVRFAEITGLWSCPGTRRGLMAFGQPCPPAFQGGPIESKPKRKRGRSPSPEPKRRPRVKRLKVPREVVDLTSDDEKETISSKTVIDLTED